MTTNLAGKVALITGGAQGLGRAFAEHLLARGAKVSLVDFNRRVGQTTESELRERHGPQSALFVPCDVTDKAQLKGAFEETTKTFGGLDIVVNNAGIGDEINWEKTIAVNLNAVIHGTKLGLEIMRKDAGGRGGLIVNIASLAAITAPPMLATYAATKYGVLGFSRSAAETYPVDIVGVRVCCLCPSFTSTEIMKNIRTAGGHVKGEVLHTAVQKLNAAVDAMGQMQPSDVANAFMRLVDDARAHGAVLLVTPAGQEYKHPRHLAGKL